MRLSPLSYTISHRFSLLGWLSILLFSFLSPLQAQKPELVLPLVHRHTTLDLGFSTDGKFLATCSATEVKLWEAKTGKLIRTFGEREATTNSQLQFENLAFIKVAVAPKGDFIIGAEACQFGEGVNRIGGWDYVGGDEREISLQVWDSKTGKLTQRIGIGGCNQLIEKLSISADGTKIAVILTDHFLSQADKATAIFEIESGTLLQYIQGQQAIFAREKNMLLAKAEDDLKLNLIKARNIRGEVKNKHIKASFSTDRPILDMVINTDGSLISALTADKIWTWSKKENWKASTYSIPTIHERNHSFFSPDGQHLTILDRSEPSTITQYRLKDGSRLSHASVELDKDHDIDMRVALSPDQKTLVYANYPIFENFSAWEKEIIPGKNITAVNPELQAIKLRDAQQKFNFGISNLQIPLLMALLHADSFRMNAQVHADGQVFHLKGPEDEGSCLFFTTSKELRCSWSSFSELTSYGQDRLATLEIKTGYSALPTDNHLLAQISIYDLEGQLVEMWDSLYIPKTATKLHYDSLRNQLFLQGNSGLRYYLDLLQKQIENPVAASKQISLDLDTAQFKLSSTDGTSIHLHKSGDSTILAKLLLYGQGEWVIATPSGLFDGSDNGKKALHFVNETEVIPLESYEARYWVPNLLQKLLSGLSPSEIRDVGALNLDELYPLIKARIEQDHLMIDIEKRAGGLGELNLYINGSIVQNDLNRQRKSHLKISLERYAKHYFTKQPNFISLQAFNQEGWLKSPVLELPAYTPGFPIQRDHKLAHFYAIIVGTSDYEGNQLDLSYAGKDAVSMHEALSIAGEQLFEDRMDIRLFTTDEIPKSGLPSKVNIKKAIDEITAKAEPIDLVLIYFAGHGKAIEEENSTPQFYYLTQSMRNFRQLEDPQARNLDAISQEELTDWLSEMGAKKKVMVLDACNSGQLVNSMIKDRAFSGSQIRALDRMRDRTGMYILAGSAADQESYEATPFGQGLLTYSLLQGMQELSIKDPNDEVDVLQLLMHAENQVPALAKSVGVVQKPKMYNQEGLSSFPIGIVNNPGAIPVAAVKPLLIQPLLLQEGELADPLDLVTQLEEHIHKLIRRGAHYTFQNIRKSELGYSIRGTYTIKGDAMVVKGYLRKGKTKVTGANFQVTGSRSNIQEIVFQLFNEVKSFLTI